MGLLDGLGIYVRPYTYGFRNGQGNGWKVDGEMGGEMGLASQRLALFVCKAEGQKQKHCRPVSPSEMPFKVSQKLAGGWEFPAHGTAANTTRNVFQFL